MKTIDIKFSQLCAEIDHWKEEAEYWKQKYEQERAEYSDFLNKQLSQSRAGLASALIFALTVEDDKNGNLVIPKKDRKMLAESFGGK